MELENCGSHGCIFGHTGMGVNGACYCVKHLEREHRRRIERNVKALCMEAINLRLELDEEKRARENVERCLRETQELRLEEAARVVALESEVEKLSDSLDNAAERESDSEARVAYLESQRERWLCEREAAQRGDGEAPSDSTCTLVPPV